MLPDLRIKLLQWAARISSRSRPPQRFSTESPENNFIVLKVRFDGKPKYSFLFGGLERGRLKGRFLRDDHRYFENEGCLLLGREGGDYIFEADYYLRGRVLSFSSPGWLILYYITGLAKIVVRWESLAQRLFNLRTPVRRGQMKILSILAGGRIGIKDSDPIIGEFDAGWISVPELLHIMYGPRLWKHPKKDETESYINMRLEALVESGDVEEDNGSRSRYRAKGRALETLSKYEEDNRRHRESVLRSWASLALTAVIAVATVAQVMLQTDFSKLFGP